MLVHAIGTRSKDVRCFRADITKALAAQADEMQAALWGRTNYIDVWSTDPDSALDTARRQFTSEQGYTIGNFFEHQPLYYVTDA